MRVGADHEVAGPRVALGDPLVADAHLDVAERGAGGRAEGPDRLLRVGQFAARRRGGVVDEEHAGRRLDGGGAELLDLLDLSLIHISEPTRLGMISYAVFCLK